MFSTSCAALSPTAAGAAPPPVDDTINTGAAFPDDGLTRLILTPIAGGPDAPTTAADGEATVTADQAAGAPAVGGDPSRLVTPELVAAMPPGASLEARDGQVGYVDEDGSFVAFDTTATPAPAPPASVSTSEDVPVEDELVETEPLYGNPYIDALAADPAVESITVIGDGTFGVTLSDPSVIDPRVFSVAEDVPLGITVEQYEPYQWALENDGTNLDQVQQIEQTEDADLDALPTVGRADGKGIVIAVIDSGVDFSHPDLVNSAWNNLGEKCGNGIDDDENGFVDDCSGWDFAYNDSSPFNQGADSHGTHVAGIITANRDGNGIVGIAPNARIMDLNVGAGSGDGMSISGASVTAAIRYAADNGADIINMSLGSQPGTPEESVAAMGAAIDYAAAKGVLVVVAAGNNNVDLASLPVYPASFNRPNMLVVGASTPTDTRADFSNFNASIVDVYAPGVLMLSTVPGPDYLFMSGTSQASPATAAVAALVMQTNPEASLDLVMQAVTSTIDHSDALSTSAVSGRINAANAIGEGEAPPIPTELQVAVTGLTSPSNEVSATVEIVTPPDVFDEEYGWELSLLHTTDDGVYAIIEHPFLVDGVETATGLNGAVQLAGAGVESVAVGTNLPAGRYSFVIEAVPTADANFRLGEAFVATFEIAGDDFDGTPPTTAPVATDGPTTTTNDGGDDGSTGGQPTTTQAGTGGDANGSPTTSAAGSDAPANSSTTAPSAGADGPTGTSPDSASPTPTSPGSATPGDGVTTTAPAGAGNGGASTSTTAPGSTATSPGSPTTEGGAGSTSTTAPGSTSPDNNDSGSTTPTPNTPAPVPDGIGSGVAKKGAWESTSVAPQAGYVNTASTVTIRGNFPSASYVWFGDQPGQVVYQNRESITVRTPLRANPGVVDITIQKSRNGVVLRIPDAFAFVAVDSGSGDPDTDDDSGNGGTGSGDTGAGDGSSDSGNGGSDDNGSSTDSGTNDGGTGGGGTSDGGSGGDDGAGSGDDNSNSSQRRARMTVGTGVDLGNGLRGASVTPNLAANTPVCSTDPCAATRR